MIKEIQLIKMRKDIEYLTKNYFHSRTAMSKALCVVPKVLSDIEKGVIPQDAKFIFLLEQIKFIKKQIQEAEDYDPNLKETLKGIRKINRMTQAQCADKIGIDPKTLWNFENDIKVSFKSKQKIKYFIEQIKTTDGTYSKLVRQYRKNNLLNQQEFAIQCGISFRTVQNIEDGMALSNQTKKKLNNILNVN